MSDTKITEDVTLAACSMCFLALDELWVRHGRRSDPRSSTSPGFCFRVVQVERGRLRADAGDALEVVTRWRAAGRPLQRATPAPRVVHLDRRSVARDPDVVEEGQHGRREQKGADGRDLVEGGEAVGWQVVGVAAGHPLHPEPVL